MGGFAIMLKAFGFDFSPEGLAKTLMGFGIDISSKEAIKETLVRLGFEELDPEQIAGFITLVAETMKRLDQRSEATLNLVADLHAQLNRKEIGYERSYGPGDAGHIEPIGNGSARINS
jgi:hypothetical protein